MKVLLSLFLSSIIGFASAAPVNNVVIFGDSLSDNGNLYDYTQHKVPQSPPYYKGHFSNGPVWIDQLITSYFPAGKIANYLANYAFGGAGVEEGKDDVLLTLGQEVETYFLVSQGKANPNSLYIMWIGANNYLAAPKDAQKEINKVNNGIAFQLERLAKAGAKQVAVMNLPNLGKTPLANAFNIQDQLTRMSTRHNQVLQEKISHLQTQYPDVQWLYFNIAQAFEEAIEHPTIYGFTNVTQACYTTESEGLSPRALGVANNVSESEINCDGYLFFDWLHPTMQAHRLVSETIKGLLMQSGVILQ